MNVVHQGESLYGKGLQRPFSFNILTIGGFNMPVKDTNTRMTVTLSKELDEKLDVLAGYQNISKNAVINNLLETTIDAQIKVWEMIKDPNALEKLIDLASAAKDKASTEQLSLLSDLVHGKKIEGYQTVDKADEMVSKLKKK